MNKNKSLKSIGNRPKLNPYNGMIHIAFIIMSFLCIIPIIIVLSTSLSSEAEVTKHGFSIVPRKMTLLAYELIFRGSKLLLMSYANTLIVTIAGTVIGISLTLALAYGISRKDYKYRKATSFFIYFTMLFNGGLVPNYIMIVSWMGLKNSLWALILPYLMNAWFVLLMKGFLQDIPMVIYESAKIDGSSELRTFIKIAVPLAKPGIATISLFFVLTYWNDWWLSLLYIEDNEHVTLQFLLYRLVSFVDMVNSGIIQKVYADKNVELPSMTLRMAMCIVAAGPMLVVFPFFQKFFVKGLTVGSVKG